MEGKENVKIKPARCYHSWLPATHCFNLFHLTINYRPPSLCSQLECFMDPRGTGQIEMNEKIFLSSNLSRCIWKTCTFIDIHFKTNIDGKFTSLSVAVRSKTLSWGQTQTYGSILSQISSYGGSIPNRSYGASNCIWELKTIFKKQLRWVIMIHGKNMYFVWTCWDKATLNSLN